MVLQLGIPNRNALAAKLPSFGLYFAEKVTDKFKIIERWLEFSGRRHTLKRTCFLNQPLKQLVLLLFLASQRVEEGLELQGEDSGPGIHVRST